MATVRVFTYDRMLAIENNAIVDGDVVGDNLILTRYDSTTINAGNVRGATGPTGPAGDVSTASMNAAILAAIPVGVILDYISTTAPTGWLAMTGQTITNGQTLYPLLWAKLPATMKSGSNIVFPDTSGKVNVGYNATDTDFDAIGKVGGSKTHTLTQAQLPNATIDIDPPSTNITIDPPSTSTSTTGSHIHTLTTAGTTVEYVASGTGTLTRNDSIATISTDAAGSHAHTVNIAAFTATVDIPSFTSGALGSGQSHPIVQPYVTFLKIIKAV